MDGAFDGDEALGAIREAIRGRFPDGLSFRTGPSRIWFHHRTTLEIIPWSAQAATVAVEVDEAELFVHFGGGALNWGFTERHPVGAGAVDWAISRIVQVGSLGIEVWSDSRRPIWGGREVTTIVREEMVGVSAKHRGRLTKKGQTETWDEQTVGLVEDPLERPQSADSLYLVYRETPELLLEVARLVRSEFGDAVSILSRRDTFQSELSIEIIPRNPEASRMILRSGKFGLEASTGDAQYINMEFSSIEVEPAVKWVLDVGREGLLETIVRRNIVSWDVNGPAFPDAVARAKDDRRVVGVRVWQPWV
jgi:hypothetical protein